MYLDGNKLECEGLIELLQMVADRSEQESLEKKSRNVVDNESYGKGRGHFLGIKTNMSAMTGDDVSSGKGESNARYVNLSPLMIYLLYIRYVPSNIILHPDSAHYVEYSTLHTSGKLSTGCGPGIALSVMIPFFISFILKVGVYSSSKNDANSNQLFTIGKFFTIYKKF